MAGVHGGRALAVLTTGKFMQRLLICLVIALGTGLPIPAHASRCVDGAIGVERIVEIDTSTGPLFGAISRQPRQARFLGPREVVLTFDDGPSPWVTTSILKTLAEHCTRATFFAVGRMAVAYPDVVREVLEQGHTVGTHTWSHPFNLPRMKKEKAIQEIEDGFAAITAAAGQEVAPFFRFTGLRDSAPLLTHLADRGVASFTVDVVSDDSFIKDPQELVQVTLRRVEQANGGIILFHDIKSGTAKALPKILEGLKARGFKVVHMRPRQPLTMAEADVDKFAGRVARNLSEAHKGPRLIPFYGAISTLREDSGSGPVPEPPYDGPPVSLITPGSETAIPASSTATTGSTDATPAAEMAFPIDIDEPAQAQ